MKSNITDQQLWNPDLPLAAPRFDDEATLLSAQPVVPFRKLLAKPGFSRPWVFGLALAGAILLGVSATALYYSRVRATGSEPVSNGQTVSSGVHGFASDTVALDESPIIEATGTEGSSVDSDTSPRVKAQVPSRTTQAPDSSNAVSKKPAHRRATVVDESSEPQYESREERRAARREAKERKQAKRERRAGRSSDELLRIRDIFEGPTRP